MGRFRASGLLAGVVGLTCACGNAPEPPSAIMGVTGAGSAASIDDEILGNRPDAMQAPTNDEPEDAGAPDEPVESPPLVTAPEAGPEPRPRVYYACTASRIIGCDYVYVTLQDSATDLCVQLTLDNCGTSSDRPLQVETPLGWRVASGSALANADECIPGEFYPASAPATDASGSIEWNLQTRAPTELVIDVTLELSSAGDGPVPASVSLSTSEFAGPLAECAG